MFVPIIGSEYPAKVSLLLDSAQRSVDILMYDWRWLEGRPGNTLQRFNLALLAAKKRGVQIRAVLNTDLLLPTLNKLGIQARVLKDKRVLHTKMLLIDERVLVIGSHNLTRNAFGTNLEASIAVILPANELRFQQFFNNLWGL